MNPARHAKISSQMSHVTFFVCGTDVPSAATMPRTIFNSDQFQWYFLFFFNLYCSEERKKSFDIFIHCLRFHKLVIPGCRLRCTCGQHNFSLNFCGFFSFLTFINEFSGVLWELDDTSSNVAICKHMHSLQLTRKIMLFRMRQFVRCVFELCPMSVYALLDKD